MFKLVLLWTDGFVFIVLGALIWLLYAISSNKLIGKWENLYKTPGRVLALVILTWFTLIAIVDSIHYREVLPNFANNKVVYSAEVFSLLDYFLRPMLRKSEKTYSQPFAKDTFVAELKKINGSYAWVKDRLLYGGAHLAAEQSILADVMDRIKPAILQAALVWLLLLAPILVVRSAKLKCELKNGICTPRILTSTTLTFWLAILCLLIFTNICWHLFPLYHIMGTDKVGDDVFYAAIKSIRTGLIIGTLTTIVTLPFAILMGTMAGYFRGWLDDIIQYIYTTISSVPGVLLIAAGILSLDVALTKYQNYFATDAQRSELRLLMLCVILGLTSWTGLCRLLRGETLKLRELEYVTAARAIGASRIRIIWRHIIPNLQHIILISVVMDFSGLVLAEAVLSYVGVGVDPTMYSWGNMINSARMEMARDPIVWWSLLGAFSLMFVLVLSANVAADALRDALDPKY